jgi:hypothetical protein
MPPFSPGTVQEIPGDNASYRRVELERYRESWQTGFWEPVFHAELKKAGKELLLDPSIVVTHRRSFGLRGFVKGRFRHGVQFGGWRASRLTAARKTLYAVLFPLIPFVLLLRILRQVLGKRRHRGKLLLSLPMVLIFLSAWAAGELTGMLLGPEE